ncbi:hypothetical protein DM793_03635 [Paenarthrobacter nitroguajacolicus]|uniref:FAD-dependent monooxygenase n=1 Tax=Paenarthrobacter nitroguajacolicus TaxID=211146 RepID=UPI0015B857CD|nr:FAD-dependent monooxygenase [Paenarthrobacter nitroguajacolicus]NWL10395.1 hypothetical protein [Paenarthrobacter nitroguajacolicus]
MSDTTLSVGIVGGGLAGLATAVGLTRAGHNVEIFEQAPALGEVGAGINISTQATKALIGLGLGDELAKIGNVVTGQTMKSMYSGEQITETRFSGDPSSGGRFSAPYYVFHRADLLGLLADAAGSNRINLGHRLASLSEHDDHVTLNFENGSQRKFDIVIGADGIRSRVRQELYGVDEATFTGQMVWRALLNGNDFPKEILGPHGFTGWVGRGRHMMVYHLRGSDLINIVTQNDSDSWVEEGWSVPGDAEDMRATFPDVEPVLQQLLARVTSCTKYGLFGRNPSKDWGRGRIQIIGDAAHPMLPNAGQGAAQAFEDAYVLTKWLDVGRDNPQSALSSFREVRIPRAQAIQRQSLLNSKVLHAGDWEKRQAAFKEREKKGDTNLGLGWILDYEPEEEWSQVRTYPLSVEEPAA